MSEEQKFHYYAFSFIANNSKENGQIYASLYWGLENNRVTLENIEYAKKLAEVPEDAVLLGVSYLGYMTSKAMHGDDTTE